MKKILIAAALVLAGAAQAATTMGVSHDNLKASKVSARSKVVRASIKQTLPIGAIDYSLSRHKASIPGLEIPSTAWEVGFSLPLTGDRGQLTPRVGLGSVSSTNGSAVVAKNNYHMYGVRFNLITGTSASPYVGIERKVDGGIKTTDFLFGVDYDLGRGIKLGSGYIRRSSSGTIYTGYTLNASVRF